jgi:hypothetical protein
MTGAEMKVSGRNRSNSPVGSCVKRLLFALTCSDNIHTITLHIGRASCNCR